MNFVFVSFSTFYLGLMFEAFLVNSDHFDVFVIVGGDGFIGRYVWLCFNLDCLLDKFDVFFI
jgi:NAD kinase